MAIEKKKFLSVKIPLINKEIELLGLSVEDFEGRFVKFDMTSDLRGKSLELRTKVKVSDGKAEANVLEAYLLGYYIRRMMRKGTDYVEDSFLVQCKDHQVRIKPFLITRKRVSRQIRSALREIAKKEIIEYVKDKTFENLVLDMINNKIQKELNIKLKKIYPLGLCEIRFIGIEDSKEYKGEVEEVQEVEEKKKPAKTKKKKEVEEKGEEAE
ncbi:MAG: hypothetical protein WC781_02715 [Candidatus Pacearchaeota archaeon]|jgi:ribosomal protein S3AE